MEYSGRYIELVIVFQYLTLILFPALISQFKQLIVKRLKGIFLKYNLLATMNS